MTAVNEADDLIGQAAAAVADRRQMRALFAELARYAKLPVPAADQWGEYERTARIRLEQVAELARSAAQGGALPLNLDACLSVARALNLAPLEYEPEPDRETADEIDAAEFAAAGPRIWAPAAGDAPDDCGCGLGAARCRALVEGEPYEDA